MTVFYVASSVLMWLRIIITTHSLGKCFLLKLWSTTCRNLQKSYFWLFGHKQQHYPKKLGFPLNWQFTDLWATKVLNKGTGKLITLFCGLVDVSWPMLFNLMPPKPVWILALTFPGLIPTTAIFVQDTVN